ncbi:uncharacterized protein LOC111069248 [Drosophila obscura]|uniref:uncharacterized protein LOC111069248 n=1 Tax=Drosophila obscura TaxID=7282 RepID=UPI001BB118B4|nr:uncharacterized protein LOC111069248 [Drosophila obscura]
MDKSNTHMIVVDVEDKAERSSSEDTLENNEARKSEPHEGISDMMSEMAIGGAHKIDYIKDAELEESSSQSPQKDTSVADIFADAIEPKTVDAFDKGHKDEEPVSNIQELSDAMDLLSVHPTHETETSDSENDNIEKQEGSNIYGPGQLPIFMWDFSSDEDEPVIPDVDINYDNIFKDLSKLSAVEKHLQLLYRPFSWVIDLICRFNIYELCILIPDSRYDPGCHPSVSVKTVNPTGLVKIYAGGKTVATGLTAESARISLSKVVRMVEELDFKMDVKSLSRNIVHASFCMPFKLDLDRLYEQHYMKVTRNCRTRPFITYNTEGENVVFAVFPSGFVLVLHSTKHSETRAAIAAFLPILAQYKVEYPNQAKKKVRPSGDISYRLLWEHRLEEDKVGQLLYS